MNSDFNPFIDSASIHRLPYNQPQAARTIIRVRPISVNLTCGSYPKNQQDRRSYRAQSTVEQTWCRFDFIAPRAHHRHHGALTQSARLGCFIYGGYANDRWKRIDCTYSSRRARLCHGRKSIFRKCVNLCLELLLIPYLL